MNQNGYRLPKPGEKLVFISFVKQRDAIALMQLIDDQMPEVLWGDVSRWLTGRDRQFALNVMKRCRKPST